MTSINIWCVYVYQSLSDVEIDVNIIWYDIHVIISIQYRFSHRNPNWFYCELILLFYTNNAVFQSLSIGGLDLSLPWDSTKTLAFMNAQTSFYDTSGFSSYPHFLSVSVFQILNKYKSILFFFARCAWKKIVFFYDWPYLRIHWMSSVSIWVMRTCTFLKVGRLSLNSDDVINRYLCSIGCTMVTRGISRQTTECTMICLGKKTPRTVQPWKRTVVSVDRNGLKLCIDFCIFKKASKQTNKQTKHNYIEFKSNRQCYCQFKFRKSQSFFHIQVIAYSCY